MPVTPEEACRFAQVTAKLNALARSITLLGDHAARTHADPATMHCYTASLARIARAQRELIAWADRKKAGDDAGQSGGTLNKGAERRPM